MKNELGLHQDSGFPYQLSINNRSRKPIPAVDSFFTRNSIKHWRSPEQAAKDLRHTGGFFHHTVQEDLKGHAD